MRRRRGARRIEPEPARAVGARLADHDRCIAPRPVATSRSLESARRPSPSRSGTGLPCGSSTRPTTIIRPGAGVGFASIRLRGDLRLRSRPAFSGLVLHRQRVGRDSPRRWRRRRGASKVNAVSFSLWIKHGSQHLLGQGRRRRGASGGRDGPRSSIAARVVISHRGDETDAEADRGARTAASAARGQDDAAASQAAAELLARPGQPAAERAGRAIAAAGPPRRG